MGNKQSMVDDQKLYDSYLEDSSKLNNLSGKVVAITGTSPGSIGEYIAKVAAVKKAKVILLLNRESPRAKQSLEDIKAVASDETTVMAVPIDLLSFDAVKEAAAKVNEVASSNGGLDVLCCNAGIMAMDDERTSDGYNIEIQACHLSHALLTKECMRSLEQAASSRDEARVVFQTSSARFNNMGNSDLEARYFEKSEPMTLGGNGSTEPWKRYHQSKLGNAAFAMALHERLKEKGSKVKALSCEPGYATSHLQQTSKSMGGIMRVMNFMAIFGYAQSPADGSLPCSIASFGPQAESGDFFMPGKKRGMAGPPKKSISGNTAVVKNSEKETCSKANQKTIWEVTEKAFGDLL
jgi:NAD(P)-dependent dehydrogenase (short-subunit alcohol dehydrogenase family)